MTESDLDMLFLHRLDAVVKARVENEPPHVQAQMKAALQNGETELTFSVDERGAPLVTVYIAEKALLTVPVMSMVSPEELGPISA